MSRKNGASAPPSNEAERLNAIREHTSEIQRLEASRAEINADINKHRKSIKALDVDLDAWRAAKRRKEMDPDVRANFDKSSADCAAALGVPLQADLFATGAAKPNPIPGSALQ